MYLQTEQVDTAIILLETMGRSVQALGPQRNLGEENMNSKQSDRRRFLKSAALAGLAVGAERSASAQGVTDTSAPGAQPGTHAHGQPARLATPAGRGVTRTITHTTYYTPLADSVGIITPASLHFMQSHSRLPDIDPATYSFVIHGLVERPLAFTLEDLKRLPSVSNRENFVPAKPVWPPTPKIP